MASSGRAEARFFALCLAGIALVTLWRVAMLPLARADLYTDDAQYWLWSRHLAWGYYSKPPLIAWIVHVSTWIGGSDDPFWIRLPFPLIHAGTAVVVALIARRLYGARVGGIAGFAYVSLPAVAVASFSLSTDTPMLACFALALLALLHLTERPSAGWALTLGRGDRRGHAGEIRDDLFPALGGDRGAGAANGAHRAARPADRRRRGAADPRPERRLERRERLRDAAPHRRQYPARAGRRHRAAGAARFLGRAVPDPRADLLRRLPDRARRRAARPASRTSWR